METRKKLPVFRLKIKDDDSSSTQIEYIALVDEPAIELNWFAFNKQYQFAADKDRRLLMGPLMVANMPIYRKDEQRGEFYTIFEKEDIFKIVQKYFRNKKTDQFNIMHNPEERIGGVYLIESIIVDSSRGVLAPTPFKDISEGSWIATIKIDNEEVWQEYIKTGKMKGFSVEGIFQSEFLDEGLQEVLEVISEIVKG